MGFREEKVEIISSQIVFLSYISFTKMKIIPLIFRLLARVVQIFIYVPLHCLVINASNQFCFFKCLGQMKHLASTQALGQNFLRYLDFLPEDTSLYKPWVQFLPFFRFKDGYKLCLFWSGIGYGFRGNYGSVTTYLSFQFQVNKKGKELYEFYDKIHFASRGHNRK